jgi:hypothetical protein
MEAHVEKEKGDGALDGSFMLRAIGKKGGSGQWHALRGAVEGEASSNAAHVVVEGGWSGIGTHD